LLKNVSYKVEKIMNQYKAVVPIPDKEEEEEEEEYITFVKCEVNTQSVMKTWCS
jgi:vacuolar-type H+-ATPase subunit F/Vma7